MTKYGREDKTKRRFTKRCTHGVSKVLVECFPYTLPELGEGEQYSFERLRGHKLWDAFSSAKGVFTAVDVFVPRSGPNPFYIEEEGSMRLLSDQELHRILTLAEAPQSEALMFLVQIRGKRPASSENS